MKEVETINIQNTVTINYNIDEVITNDNILATITLS
jgi:hypothetical protein